MPNYALNMIQNSKSNIVPMQRSRGVLGYNVIQLLIAFPNVSYCFMYQHMCVKHPNVLVLFSTLVLVLFSGYKC